MPKARRNASDALLCERCGYELGGLARADNCPECGKPIGESLPENRTGSAWQRRLMSPFSWAASVVFALMRPCRIWRTARPRTRHWDVLVSFNLVLTGLIAGGAVAGVSRRLPSLYTSNTPYAWILIMMLLVYLVIRLLIGVEVAGIRYFGRKRGWRISKDIARTIVAHASFGWILTGLGIAGVYLWAGRVSVIRLWGWDYAPLPLPFHSSGSTWAGFTTQGIEYYWPWLVGSLIVGMLVFELFVYLGFRAMRYANPPGSERHLRDHAGEANISTEPESARRM